MADTKEDKDMTATTDVAETAKTVAAEKTADKPTEKMTEKSADNAIPERLPKVLIVDDDPRLRDLLRRYLGENGFSVSVADGAQNMDRLWLRERFDALVLDLMMPGEDGLQILRRRFPDGVRGTAVRPGERLPPAEPPPGAFPPHTP